MAIKRPLLFSVSQLMAAPETLALPHSLFTALLCLPSNAPITSAFVLTQSEKKILFGWGGVGWGRSEKLPDQLDLWLGLKLVYLIIRTVFFCLCRQSFPPLPAAASESPTPGAERRRAQSHGAPAKEGNQWRKILLRAHTFLSRFERVSFNFALISICCFWDGSAARSTRRNKPSARASSQKDLFQLGPFILFIYSFAYVRASVHYCTRRS